MPQSSETTLYVDKDSDLAVVVDMILRSPAKKIFLVIPEDARFASHILNFQLLQREAETVRKEVVIVSLDIRVQGLAAKSGMKVHHLSEKFGAKEPEEDEGKEEGVVRLVPARVADIILPGGRGSLATRTPQKLARSRDGSSYRGLTKGDMHSFLRKRSQSAERETIHIPVQEDGLGQKEKQGAQSLSLSSFSTLSLLKRFAGHPEVKQEQVFLETSRYVNAWQPKKRKWFSFFSFLPQLRSRDIFSYVFAIFVIFTVLIGGFVASLTLPSADITIYPHIDTREAIIPLRVETTFSGVDEKNSLIGGQILQETQHATQIFSASGQQNIEQYASGKIRVYNEFSSAPQTLVSGTRFVSNDGLLFRTDETVVIAGAQIDGGKIVASSTIVSVHAAEAGEQYNIGPSTFSIPGFKGTPKFIAFYGKSDTQMSGGFKGIARIITDSDIFNAKDTLLKAVDGRASDKLRGSIPQGYFLAPDALSELPAIFTFDHKPGDQTDSLNGKVTSTAMALVFKQEDVNQIIDSYFANSIENTSNLKILSDKNITYTFGKRDFISGKFVISLNVKQPIGYVVVLDTLRDDLAGLNEEGARLYLASLQGVDKTEVKFWPFWVRSIPKNEEKITINVKYMAE
ncbi:MAG: hypothetical protein HYV65_02040 [Candidatus Spechtbacteria bacterium]|nr:hypothetical protein [Candidatus Spechtbacteria bacterium]